MASESTEVAGTFALEVWVHGLGLVVPDAKTGTVHVLFPSTAHFGHHEHVVKVLYAVEDDADPKNVPGHFPRPVKWDGRDCWELDATGTCFRFGMPASAVAGSARLDLATQPTVNLSAWAGRVPREFLDRNHAHGMAGAVRFGKGAGDFASDGAAIDWEFEDEDPGTMHQQANRLKWTMQMSRPVTIDAQGSRRTVRPLDAARPLRIDIMHSIPGDLPSHGEYPESWQRSYEIGYKPHHVEAYSHFLPYSPISTLRTQVPAFVADGVTIKGIHPVTCTLGAGEPGP